MNLKKHLPTREQLKEVRALRFLGHLMFEPNLWHFNRYSLSVAALIGGFWCFSPIPFQMIPCVINCIWARCNIAVAVAIVWISNPLTMPPMMYFAWRVGAYLMGIEQGTPPDSFTLDWFAEQLVTGWKPLLLGCLVCGLTTGITLFTVVRGYYRWRIARYRYRRKNRKPGEITRI